MRLVSAWIQGNSGYLEVAGTVDDPLIGAATRNPMGQNPLVRAMVFEFEVDEGRDQRTIRTLNGIGRRTRLLRETAHLRDHLFDVGRARTPCSSFLSAPARTTHFWRSAISSTMRRSSLSICSRTSSIVGVAAVRDLTVVYVCR